MSASSCEVTGVSVLDLLLTFANSACSNPVQSDSKDQTKDRLAPKAKAKASISKAKAKD